MQVDSLSRKARGPRKASTKTRKEFARPARRTRALQTSTRARTVAELDIGRRTAGDPEEERMTIPPVTTATRRKARVTRKAKGKANTWMLWKRISLVKQPQPCRILHKHRVQLERSRPIPNVASWIVGVTINFVSTGRQAGAEYLLLYSCAQLHACPITYRGQKVLVAWS